MSDEKAGVGVRGLVRAVGVAVGMVLTSPLALIARLDMLLGRDEWFKSFAQLLSLFPGRTGSYLRVGFYYQTLKHCSTSWTMQIYSKFTHPEASVADGVYVGMHSTLGRAELGRNVLIADYVQILSGKHQHGRPGSWTGKHDGGQLTSVAIGANTWVGGGAIVMSSIGEGCIVGAGSVVTGPVPSGVVVAGNPARVLREAQTSATVAGTDG